MTKTERYFWATGAVLTVGAINARRFDTYVEAEKDALESKIAPAELQSLKIYRETFEQVATVTIRCERQIQRHTTEPTQ